MVIESGHEITHLATEILSPVMVESRGLPVNAWKASARKEDMKAA